MLVKFCEASGFPERIDEALQVEQEATAASVERHNPVDDLKRTSGDTYTGIRQALNLLQTGNNADAFMRDILAPRIEPGLQTYDDLVANSTHLGILDPLAVPLSGTEVIEHAIQLVKQVRRFGFALQFVHIFAY